ncbi:hypothetical protein [Amycolatopsis rubida]|uniref:Streptogrisin D n=1 Tax=Amycolatopsis rubida TaxID=112413 RepID=A0A1I5RQM7_9PSEU|nr:hypothetical protein [Amycolatopsis rubida]SFP60216.1 streptogrisin D [Amycolatopsis rubida]
MIPALSQRHGGQGVIAFAAAVLAAGSVLAAAGVATARSASIANSLGDRAAGSFYDQAGSRLTVTVTDQVRAAGATPKFVNTARPS